MKKSSNLKKQQRPIIYPPSILRLLQKFPDVSILQVEQQTDEQNFAKQKNKQNEYLIEGGAIGIITIPDGRLVLAKRSGPNSGWALPGGRVEVGEWFEEALVREVFEETGAQVAIETALVVENKTFISPDGERLLFWLSVFRGYTVGNTLPYQTKEAIKEGLEIDIFSPDALPEEMLLSDRQKIISYCQTQKLTIE